MRLAVRTVDESRRGFRRRMELPEELDDTLRQSQHERAVQSSPRCLHVRRILPEPVLRSGRQVRPGREGSHGRQAQPGSSVQQRHHRHVHRRTEHGRHGLPERTAGRVVQHGQLGPRELLRPLRRRVRIVPRGAHAIHQRLHGLRLLHPLQGRSGGPLRRLSLRILAHRRRYHVERELQSRYQDGTEEAVRRYARSHPSPHAPHESHAAGQLPSGRDHVRAEWNVHRRVRRHLGELDVQPGVARERELALHGRSDQDGGVDGPRDGVRGCVAPGGEGKADRRQL
mmetsp:Transcript_28142/g.82900  ORF Transcript_28142/g.82900 Transcript_28142/m.82900 type:complete len:284 (-) Transcript_28142:261-1112(-)